MPAASPTAGTIDIDEGADDLRLKVKIGGLKNKQAKTVHDLKQLSGGGQGWGRVGGARAC